MDVRIPIADETLARIMGGIGSEPFNALIARGAAFSKPVFRRLSAVRISLPRKRLPHLRKVCGLRMKKGGNMLIILLFKAGIGARKGE